MLDVVIIGGGISGASVARSLSKYKLDMVLLEKETDVANGTTKANSAIVHGGYDPMPGSLKARFNREGNLMMEKLTQDLDVPFKRTGALIVALNDEDKKVLEEIYDRGLQNQIEGLEIIGQEELREREPNINKDAIAALYSASNAIVGPYELAIALTENAVSNGLDLRLNQKVIGIDKIEGGYEVKTETDSFKTKYVVNAAGVYADEIHNMVGEEAFKIRPRKGEYFLLDKGTGALVNSIIFQTPTPVSKGVVVLPTVHGNLLVGPDANIIDNKDNVATTEESLNFVRSYASKAVDNIPFWKTIRSFSGLRASSDRGDFIVEEAEGLPGFIDVAGIESPGLTAAPAIGEYVAEMLKDIDGNFVENKDYNPKRKGEINFMELPMDEKAKLIKENPQYGRIICRCENITEAEIVDAIHRSPGARTVDGVKRRVRPGMGRCQGGFCEPRVLEILARELNLDVREVLKDKEGSNIAISQLGDEI